MSPYTDADLPATSGNAMRPVFLRTIADWLDTYDKLADYVIASGRVVGNSDQLQAARNAVAGKAVQEDLRAWADALENGKLKMYIDDDGYYMLEDSNG